MNSKGGAHDDDGIMSIRQDIEDEEDDEPETFKRACSGGCWMVLKAIRGLKHDRKARGDD